MSVKKEENNRSLKMLWNGSSKGWRLAEIVYPNNSTIMKLKKWLDAQGCLFFPGSFGKKRGEFDYSPA